jgi:hypothetical protein
VYISSQVRKQRPTTASPSRDLPEEENQPVARLINRETCQKMLSDHPRCSWNPRNEKAKRIETTKTSRNDKDVSKRQIRLETTKYAIETVRIPDDAYEKIRHLNHQIFLVPNGTVLYFVMVLSILVVVLTHRSPELRPSWLLVH